MLLKMLMKFGADNMLLDENLRLTETDELKLANNNPLLKSSYDFMKEIQDVTDNLIAQNRAK